MSEKLRFHIQGFGKVGKLLAKELPKTGCSVTVRAARDGIPEAVDANVIVFALRDGLIQTVAEQWSQCCTISKDAVVLHCAGSLGPDVLAALRPKCAGVGLWHPLVSIVEMRPRRDHADLAEPVESMLSGAFAVVSGDTKATKVACRMSELLKMQVKQAERIDFAAYHAAAVMVTTGTIASCHAAIDLMIAAGFDEQQCSCMLAPLIRSVATNLQRLGPAQALSGPVARGDSATIRRHLAVLGNYNPEHVPLYKHIGLVQLKLMRSLKQFDPETQRKIEDILANSESENSIRNTATKVDS